jgi:hypothetical protein
MRTLLVLGLALLAACSWTPFGPETEQGKRQCWTTSVEVEFVARDTLTWEQADSVTLEDCRG